MLDILFSIHVDMIPLLLRFRSIGKSCWMLDVSNETVENILVLGSSYEFE